MIEISFDSKFINDKLSKVNKRIHADLFDAIADSSEILRDEAIKYLNSVAKEPGKSVQGGRITDKSSWVIEPISDNEVILKCLSEHAAVVEFGGYGKILYAPAYGHFTWPVGRQQGKPPIPVDEVKVQAGYSYLSRTRDNKSVKSKMSNKIKNDIMKGIESEL